MTEEMKKKIRFCSALLVAFPYSFRWDEKEKHLSVGGLIWMADVTRQEGHLKIAIEFPYGKPKMRKPKMR